MSESCEVTRISDASPTTSEPVSPALRDHTTLRVGGPARRVVVVRSESEFIQTVADCDARGEPVLIVGGGSNLLVSDDGFDGTLVLVEVMGIDAQVSDCAGAYVTVGAGQNWDAFVARAVEEEWVGVETLAGIPGRVGATPMQNVGAYGADVAQTIASVRTWDRRERAVKTFAAADCGFGYRTSRFKQEPGRHLITRVSFQFRLGSLSGPIAYAELAGSLGVELGQRADLRAVRESVVAIRRRKGMVLDETDHDSWSGGSFFTNPVLSPADAEYLPAEAPRYPSADGIKTSAAWLIQNAGFPKGYGNDRAALSSKHVLAVTNRGGARAEDLVRLAREVRDGVQARFGISLVPEVNLVGLGL